MLYGDGVTVKGRLSGTGVSRVPVVLEYQPHPFAEPFRQLGLPVGTRRDGSYRFTIDPLLLTARLRVVSRTRTAVASPVAVVHCAARVGLIGSALGAGITLALARILGNAFYLVEGQHGGLLYGVKTTDPAALGAACAALIAMATLSGLVPARQATRIDPLIALRNE